ERNPQQVADWLSARAGQPIAFDRVQSRWTRRGPLLQLEGLRIGAGPQAIRIGEAEMLVSVYAGLIPGQYFSQLRIRGLLLTLEQGADRRWRVRGLPGQQQGADPLQMLERLGELQVIGAKLQVLSPGLGIDTQLPRADLRMRVKDGQLRAGARVWVRNEAPPLQAALEFTRRSGDGRAWLALKQADLAEWSPLLRWAGVQAVGGQGQAAAWLYLRRHRVVLADVDADLQDIVLRGAPLDGRAMQVSFDAAQTRARWRARPGGWRFDAPRLRIESGGKAGVLDGLTVAGGREYGLWAQQLDLRPLLAVALLGDRWQSPVRRWLLGARPAGRLHAVEIHGRQDRGMRAQGRVEGLQFAAVGAMPGFSGLAGELRGDAAGFVFDTDADAAVRIDWARGFGTPRSLRLQGALAGWRDADGWRVGSDDLRLHAAQGGARLRGGLHFTDATRPRLDLAASLQSMPVRTARGWLPAHALGPQTTRWLDAALIGGQVDAGRILVAGDLDDWPFAAGRGLLHAQGRLSGATIKFHQDWPPLQQAAADLRFADGGMSATGRGVLEGVDVQRTTAAIPRFDAPVLEVQAQTTADAAKLLALLRRSPLQKQYGETLAGLAVRGPALAQFQLRDPLGDGVARPQLGGTVDFKGAQISDLRWKLAFDQVHGQLRYDQQGFAADRLVVRHEGQPGRLSLRAGGFVRDRAQALEADLEATLGADVLLARAPELAWLKPYISGRSQWTTAVAIPRGANAKAAAPTRLQLRSDLVGTTLALPAPLQKSAATALPTSIEAALPFGRGDIHIAFGRLLALRARQTAGTTGVRLMLGTDRVSESAPAAGLIASGRTPVLDPLPWLTLLRSGRPGATRTPLQGIDIQTERLLLFGAGFADARLQVSPSTDGLAVKIQSPALAGALNIPQAGGAAVRGRFQRMRWRSTKPGTQPPAVAARSTVDPAAIPPLQIDIDDMRVGDIALGQALLRTRPDGDGLRIDQLQFRAPRQRIDATGDWRGRGATATTRIDARIDSDDYGALLGGAGFGGRLAGGRGQTRLEARWPGGPEAFRPATVQGLLSLEVRDGRLVEIEPGAGRVVGLLSVTELPRRLMLDFRDLFEKGFAFKRIEGKVRLGGGLARAEGLVIDGPAAKINISGAADLRAQTYDQRIEVLPKTGNM
ncbi:MAG TPA: YhdP family protein, partial [Xanthomonadaceae bacterium]|nr:YhdP family protein [Xanthomonadaceae bacterium]